MNITYGTHSFDFSTLPAKSVEAMLSRGVTHYLGSEQASKVTNAIRREIAGEEGEVEDVTLEQVRAYRAANVDQVAAWKGEFVADAIAALKAGTVGVSERGPSKDPIEAEMERLARAEIRSIMTTNGLKFVKPEGADGKAPKIVVFADGQSKTMADMLSARLASHGERLRKEADRAIKTRQREAEKAKASGPVTSEAIGL